MRVFLVDSQPIFREGLRSIITAEQDLRVVGEASNHDGLLQTVENVDVVILEGGMDALAFLGLLEKSRRKGNPPYVLVLAKEIAEQHAIQFVSAGADGYMYKTESPDAVLAALRKVS